MTREAQVLQDKSVPKCYIDEERNYIHGAFMDGVYWADSHPQEKESPLIKVEDKLPEEGQRVLAGFLYYCKYDDRESKSIKFIAPITYKNGMWIDDDGTTYYGKEVCKDDIQVVCWMPIPSF